MSPLRPVQAKRYVGVVGPATGATRADLSNAREVGRLLASAGVATVCGGGPGVMEAACRGAQEAGGLTIGLLPGLDRTEGNPYLSVSIPTGLGELRNGLIVRSSQALIAVGGGWGTLSEIALAMKARVPVVAIESWELSSPGLIQAPTPAEAVATALELAH